MPTLPQELLGLAKEVHALGSEVGYRSGISRAYYAGYHVCKDWLESLPGVPTLGACLDGEEGKGRKSGVHAELIGALANPAPELKCAEARRVSKVLSMQLSVFKGHRVKADYFLQEIHPFKEWSSSTIEGVEQILGRIAALDPSNAIAVAPSLAPATASVEGDVQLQAAAPKAEPKAEEAAAVKRPALKLVK